MNTIRVLIGQNRTTAMRTGRNIIRWGHLMNDVLEVTMSTYCLNNYDDDNEFLFVIPYFVFRILTHFNEFIFQYNGFRQNFSFELYSKSTIFPC